MKNIKRMKDSAFAMRMALLSTSSIAKVWGETKLDTAKIEQLTGSKGKLNEKEGIS